MDSADARQQVVNCWIMVTMEVCSSLKESIPERPSVRIVKVYSKFEVLIHHVSVISVLATWEIPAEWVPYIYQSTTLKTWMISGF